MTVATVGVHIVDILTRPVERIPEGQDTVLVDQIRLTAAGAAAGTAVDLVKLGNDVVTMGAVGDDELGDFLLAVLAKRGVDASRLVRRADEQTAASILPIRPDGGRPSFHVPGANLGVTLADLDVEALRGARAVHLGGVDVTFGLGDPAFFALLDELRAGGTIVTMDLLSEMPDLLGMARAFLPHVDYVLPNASQALLMTGLGGDGSGANGGSGGGAGDGGDVAEAALALLADGPRGVLVTLGGDGSLVTTADGVEHLPALKVEVSDTTGCGDAYCAGFITGLLHGRDVLEAARWGTAAAARVATGLGSDAGITDLDSTLALLT
ncbi:carbohydrate kinase family protein [Nonomuraea roseoviolacea]|uniref:Sugar/nucleoside kinase (Ribokinase family) n=1 Tax=Nonomuraea roseoviolacea subsp. carminata TaxID=160689 RepID=A0ABT1K548_9ACTN|nr:carbohydrate kinase family protein [Nonomuraea roseoviolacea]MCP2349123.1 sugar/nucleoside kinase (ribokinase family) [Nonomuraea roseoviolacea subsp. carminata]